MLRAAVLGVVLVLSVYGALTDEQPAMAAWSAVLAGAAAIAMAYFLFRKDRQE